MKLARGTFVVLAGTALAAACRSRAPAPLDAGTAATVSAEPGDAETYDADLDATSDDVEDAPFDADASAPAPIARAWTPPPGKPADDPLDASDQDPHCPAGMQYVAGSFCPKVALHCLKSEENGANHITICHAFEHDTRCEAEREKRAFCIDTYEFPNRKGAHPSWMVTWYDAQATCLSQGKRLCYESEWTMACEGPDETPFPYGWERDNTACNVDSFYIPPKLDLVYGFDAGDADTQGELARLDQSVPSGALAKCTSGYGVHDMTGNFDEWTINDEPIPPEGADTGKWAALKGGAWGHVRNACRPHTTSHSPGFSYYFVSFRCCADAKGDPAYEPPKTAFAAPKVIPGDHAPRVKLGPDSGAPGPSKRKVPPIE